MTQKPVAKLPESKWVALSKSLGGIVRELQDNSIGHFRILFERNVGSPLLGIAVRRTYRGALLIELQTADEEATDDETREYLELLNWKELKTRPPSWTLRLDSKVGAASIALGIVSIIETVYRISPHVWFVIESSNPEIVDQHTGGLSRNKLDSKFLTLPGFNAGQVETVFTSS